MTLRIASVLAWTAMLAFIALHLASGDWIIPAAAIACAVPIVLVRYARRRA